MSLPRYAPALWLECRAQPLLQTLYLGMAALAQLALFILPWPGPWRALAMVMLCIPLTLIWRRRCELGGEALTLHWDSDGQWWRWQADGLHLLSLEPEQLVTPAWIVLRLREGVARRGRVVALILTPRAIGAENFRRLLLRLRG